MGVLKAGKTCHLNTDGRHQSTAPADYGQATRMTSEVFTDAGEALPGRLFCVRLLRQPRFLRPMDWSLCDRAACK